MFHPASDADAPPGGLVVLGLGNPIRRDDAAGLEVVRLAAERAPGAGTGKKVAFKEHCAGAFDLLPEVLGFDELVVVDAWHTEQSIPGRVRVLRQGEVTSTSAMPPNPHLAALPQVLGWAARAGMRPPRLVAVVAVEVGDECLEFGEGLTEAVRAAIPVAVDELERVIREVSAEPASSRGAREGCP